MPESQQKHNLLPLSFPNAKLAVSLLCLNPATGDGQTLRTYRMYTSQPQVFQYPSCSPPVYQVSKPLIDCEQQQQQEQEIPVNAVAERQPVGFALAVILMLWFWYCLFQNAIACFDDIYLVNSAFGFYFMATILVSCTLLASFFTVILIKKDYLAGRPRIRKFWPVMLACFIVILRDFINLITSGFDAESLLFFSIINMMYLLSTWAIIKLYSHNDFGTSSCICFKPYIMVLHK